jgi:hypothetical protein
MLRMTLIGALLLGLLAGCSSNQPVKTAEAKPTQPSAPAATPAPMPVKETLPPGPAAAKPAPAQREATKAKPETGSPMDRFAKCLADKGAAMYGVFWCDHCREQKEKFGDSFKYVKYVECVTQDAPKTLIPECKAQGIKHTPTWIFEDGEHVEGVMGLDQLAMKTHCKLP